jgi:hypothetical protein
MQAFLKEGKYKQALVESRAYITQYTIWHQSHTVPAIRNGMPKEDSILEIDIRALGDLVDDLMFCHIKTEMMDDFPTVLERLRSNIDDPDWQRKITYFHALHALWPDWDRQAGRRELKKLGSIANDKDEEILQVYLDLFGSNLSFSQKQNLIERILTYSRKFSERLHYRGTKAVLSIILNARRLADNHAEQERAAAAAKTWLLAQIAKKRAAPAAGIAKSAPRDPFAAERHARSGPRLLRQV